MCIKEQNQTISEMPDDLINYPQPYINHPLSSRASHIENVSFEDAAKTGSFGISFQISYTLNQLAKDDPTRGSDARKVTQD